MQPLAREIKQVSSASDCAAQILDVTPLLMRRIRREMRQRTMSGTSVPQFRTLNYLRNHRGASLSQVAEFLGLSRPSTSKLVQRLVTQKVVARRTGSDRRRICLSLTASGRKALALAYMETHQQLVTTLESLDQEGLATVSAAFQILGKAFAQGGGDGNLS